VKGITFPPPGLKRIPDTLELSINSCGGDVFSAWAIYNMAVRFFGHENITTFADGDCASVAVLLLMLGDKRVGHPSSRLLFHSFTEPMHGLPLESIRERSSALTKEQKRFCETIAALMCANSGIRMSKCFPEALDTITEWVGSKESIIHSDVAVRHNLFTELSYSSRDGYAVVSSRKSATSTIPGRNIKTKKRTRSKR
jgi:hypothetical protein